MTTDSPKRCWYVGCGQDIVGPGVMPGDNDECDGSHAFCSRECIDRHVAYLDDLDYRDFDDYTSSDD